MVQSYKKNYQLQEPYDAIIIGSGLGSLTTAALLSKEGKRVLVLERHYTAGGFTHVFKRRGYEWDVGIHYIGEMNRPQSIVKRIFDYITEGRLKWADMGEVYDRIVIGNQIYDLVKGVQNFKEQLIRYFPEEADAIHEYVNLVFKANKTSRNFYLNKVLSPFTNRLIGGFMRAPYLKYAQKTTLEVLQQLTQNETLIKVLTGQYGDYGLPPKESSFVMHATLVKHFFSGGYFPIGGSSQLVETIAPVLQQWGSTILVSAEVAQVLVEDNKAVGVQMKDGTIFRANTIISGAGVMTTYKKLLPTQIVEKYQLKSQLSQVKNSVAHLCLYVGLKGAPAALNLPKANYWVYPAENSHEENINRYIRDIEQPFPVVYISFPSAKDPDWTNRYPDCSTIDIITLMPYEIFAEWENHPWKKRGQQV